MNRGLIFDIRRYSVHDGPGIRTTVFLKGCPLSCAWCHNPEGLVDRPQTIRRERTLNVRTSYHDEIVGKYLLPGEVMESILRDRIFFEESGGGVTFSGGEPLMQPDFLLETLSLCRDEGIHTALDTSGHVVNSVFTEAARNTGLLLFDIKTADTGIHRQYTGHGNELVLGNLASVAGTGTPVIARIPLIPGVNDDNSSMEAIRDLLKEVKAAVIRVDLLPWHRLGRNKYVSLGMRPPPLFEQEIGSEQMKAATEIFTGAGFRVKKGG